MNFKPLKIHIIIALSIVLFSCSQNENDDAIYVENTNDEILAVSDIKYSTIETEILNLVNEYRVSNDLPKLTILNIISNVASEHTAYMVKNGTISHDNFQERVIKLQNNAKAKLVGENVAYGFNSAQLALNGWLNSPEHKKTIDTPSFTHFGISTKTDGEGKNYFTQIFIKK